MAARPVKPHAWPQRSAWLAFRFHRPGGGEMRRPVTNVESHVNNYFSNIYVANLTIVIGETKQVEAAKRSSFERFANLADNLLKIIRFAACSAYYRYGVAA
jgi:hypothetical protein